MIWRIILDFEVLPDENFIAMFEFIEGVLGQMIDPHEEDEDCIRFWALAGMEATDEYEDTDAEDQEQDEFGLVGYIPPQVCYN